jgi:hypothetical protein
MGKKKKTIVHICTDNLIILCGLTASKTRVIMEAHVATSKIHTTARLCHKCEHIYKSKPATAGKIKSKSGNEVKA